MKKDFIVMLLTLYYEIQPYSQILEEFRIFCSERVLDMCEYYDVNLKDMLKELNDMIDLCGEYTYEGLVLDYLDYEKRLTALLADIKDNLYSDICSIASERVLEISARRTNAGGNIVGWVESSFEMVENINDFLGSLCSSLMQKYVNIYLIKFKPIVDAFHKVIENGNTFYITCDIDEETKSSRLKSKNDEKILDYRKLVKLAESNGFVYDRSNGDHNIYKHKKTNKIVVIPSRDVGAGLSFAIQKQIELNSKN